MNTEKSINNSRVFDQSKSRVASASGKIKEGVEEVVGESKHVAQFGKKVAEKAINDGVQTVSDRSKKMLCAIEHEVQERPLRSIAIAAGVGLLLGRFLKRAA